MSNGRRLYEWQLEIGQWADRVFPNRTTASCFLKLFEESAEFLRNPKDGEELADLLIMVVDLANLNGIDIEEALEAKHQKNLLRQWKIDSVMGTMSHVKPEIRLFDDPEGEGNVL